MGDKKNMNIILPGLYDLFQINNEIIDTQLKSPEVFLDNIKISGVWGSFPYSIWSAEISDFSRTPYEDIEYIVKEYNSKGISLFYSFSNPLVKKEHLDDAFCNLCLDIGNKPLNAVIVSSSALANHIRERYKKLSIVLKADKNTKLNDKSLTGYKFVILDYLACYFKDYKNLINKDKIVLRLNRNCTEYCLKADVCFKQISKKKLSFETITSDFCKKYSCEDNISPDLTTESVYEQEVSNFIISDFGYNKKQILELYLNYFVKETYKENLRERLYSL